MYYQAPFITTPTGAQGLGLDENKYAVVDADYTMVDAVVDLYKDDRRLVQIMSDCGPYITTHLTRKQAMNVVRADIDVKM